ncbi:HlyD family efflux transporter periplasmic adaptor subunit [Pusillimonas sp. TS35]|uniref:HlyD family secretion protein n=1 Tax=Paracandidimonas lactea TaxID=2895524 RepID=UPI0013714448|nr:HlyD family efflux transporter periplasmic adaptor subunit [Paracandidimonas lactea]MYN13907.1 HlyD family efflux transporter periplasmic adaptor subunit [Pusillimonas sp. TS35]
MNLTEHIKKKLPLILVIAVAASAYGIWRGTQDSGPGAGFMHGNGRIEATEIDIATKLPGRVDQILVNEGDFVKAGQVLAVMNADSLQAQLDEAQARQRQAEHAVVAGQAQVALRESDVAAQQAVVKQRESDLFAARQRLKRSQSLAQRGASSQQELDDDRARQHSAEAGLAAAKALVISAQAGVAAAKADLVGAESAVAAAAATAARIEADLKDSSLKAPRDGRIQLRVAQPGEVLAAGGRVLNMLDLADVSMTFFMPEAAAGRLAMGSEVRIILDAAPQYVIPAEVSFVASQAQFTPKTVETASERQKLMFRIKARLPVDLLLKNLEQVKTGLPGVAWVRTDPTQPWPESLAIRLPNVK